LDAGSLLIEVSLKDFSITPKKVIETMKPSNYDFGLIAGVTALKVLTTVILNTYLNTESLVIYCLSDHKKFDKDALRI